MDTTRFVATLREPHLRIGVLMATLRNAGLAVDFAITMLHGDSTAKATAREILEDASADIAETLDLISKADGE